MLSIGDATAAVATILAGLIAGVGVRFTSSRPQAAVFVCWIAVAVFASLFEPTLHGLTRLQRPTPWPFIATAFPFVGLAFSKDANIPWLGVLALMSAAGFLLTGFAYLFLGLTIASRIAVAMPWVVMGGFVFVVFVGSRRR